ncbi:juvenile hormone acid O-methyltransferase-like [Dermacentor variabilis]|uniref:juvenile hormone acid O-methyltransferase-like n=1 Tax=Dermacentor variabilis TaxID=34621 RepID=UPI003F5B13F9
MQILDIGCGTGDYTRDFLLPCCLPCDRLVGIDSSIEMIEYAKRHSAHEKIEYELLDIGDDLTEFISRRGPFDRVFSFYCLHWVRDQGAALKNVAALMAPGGQCLLVIPASSQLAAVWRLLAEMDHWVKYSEVLSTHFRKPTTTG